MTPSRRFVTAQLVIGLVVLVMGAALLLDNLGVPGVRGLWVYWPVALILVGAAKLAQARNIPDAAWASVLALAGTWILLNNLHIIDLTFWRGVRTFWPLILVGVGLSIVWRAVRRPPPPAPLDARNEVRAMAALGGVKRASGAPDFQGGEATAIMGGVHLDLRKATLAREAVLTVFAMWGGIELVVPETWSVDVQVTALLGGTEDKTRPVTDPAAPRLVIRGTVLMGGIEVKN